GAAYSRPAGRPQRGQSQVSGSTASMANAGRTSCPLAQKNETRCLGADSPRSFSPIGPAPTLLPRIALPPATFVLLGMTQGLATDRYRVQLFLYSRPSPMMQIAQPTPAMTVSRSRLRSTSDDPDRFE